MVSAQSPNFSEEEKEEDEEKEEVNEGGGGGGLFRGIRKAASKATGLTGFFSGERRDATGESVSADASHQQDTQEGKDANVEYTDEYRGGEIGSEKMLNPISRREGHHEK